MFVGLVRQRPEDVCSASNDQGENLQNPAKQKTPARKRKRLQILKSRCIHGIVFIFQSSNSSSRFVCTGVVLRFSQKHTCLEQGWTTWIIFWVVWPIFLERHFFLGSEGSRAVSGSIRFNLGCKLQCKLASKSRTHETQNYYQMLRISQNAQNAQNVQATISTRTSLHGATSLFLVPSLVCPCFWQARGCVTWQ